MDHAMLFKSFLISLPYIVMIFFAVSGIHLMLYIKMPKYYMFIIKLFSKWSDNTWRLSVIYTFSQNINFFKEFEIVLRNLYGSYKKRVNLVNKKAYDFGIFSLIIQSDFDFSVSQSMKVEMHFSMINVTYKNSIERLEELQRLFHKLEEHLSIEDKTYDLKIQFSRNFHNPFYGVAIQHLGEEHIQDFECSFSADVFNIRHGQNTIDDESVIRVFKDCIDVNNSEFDIVKLCTKKCLLLE